MAQPTAVTIPSRYSTTPATFTFTAGTTSETLMAWMPGDILIATNENVAAKTITIKSNPKNRRAEYDVTAYSIAAGAFVVFPRFPPQDDGVLSVTCESTDVKLARLSTAPQPS
jgi:hypothetical protein